MAFVILSGAKDLLLDESPSFNMESRAHPMPSFLRLQRQLLHPPIQ